MHYVVATPAGASVALLDLGAGPEVRVYIGGLGSASTVGFAPVVGHPALAAAGRHLLVDLIGSGWSDHDDTFGHTIDEHAFVAGEHQRIVEELRKLGDPVASEFGRTAARWSSRGLHRTAVSLLADRESTFREQFAAFDGPRRYVSGELSQEELASLRETGADVRVVAGAGHVLMWDNLDGFVDALR